MMSYKLSIITWKWQPQNSLQNGRRKKTERNPFINKLKLQCLITFNMLNLYWGLDYKSMKNNMISLISNHKHSINMKREAKKVVVFTMFYIRVPPPVVLFVFQVLTTIQLGNKVTTLNSKQMIIG